MSRVLDSRIGWTGEVMNLLRALTLACLAVLGAACTSQQEATKARDPVNPGSPVVREGIIYTPVSIGSQGCVLYSIRIPGGQAPAALAYQRTEGRFSYERPDQCVKAPAQ